MICKNLTKQFDNKILFSNLSFQIEKGILYIQGASGSGKTTLINILMGLIKPDSGSFEIDKNIAYCGNETLMFVKKSLNENINLFFEHVNNQLKNSLINDFDMVNNINKPLYKLSEGQILKAKLIFTLLKQANVYFLDEIFASLDEKSRNKLYKYLNELAKDSLVVVISHNLIVDNLKINTIVDLNTHEVNYYSNSNTKLINKEPNIKKKINPLLFLNSKIKLYTLLIFLCFLTFLSFGIGMSFYNSNSTYSSLNISLNSDPFNYHKTQLVKKIDINYLSSNYIQTLNLSSNQEKLLLITSPEINDNNIYYYDFLNVNSFKNKEIIAIDNHNYVVSLPDINQASKDDFPNYIEIESMFDKFMSFKNILVVNNSFFKDLLIFGSSSLNKGFYPLLNINYANKSLNNKDGKYPIVIENKENYLSIPKVEKGTPINFQNNSEFTYITDNPISNEEIIVSYDVMYNLILYFNQSSGLILNNNQILNDKLIIDNFIVKDIIHDYSSNIKIYSYCLLISSVFLLVLIIVTINLSKKTLQKSKQIDNNIIKYNFLNNNIALLNTIDAIFIPLIPFIISSILYLTVFLNMANLISLQIEYEDKDISKFYYYSMEPLNNYYNNITSPIKFLHYTNLYLFSFMFFIIIAISIYICLKPKKVKKSIYKLK